MIKIKRKMSSFVLALSFCLQMTAYAADNLDYSNKLAELKDLIAQCENRGIAVDYEKINYTTIERFEDYINRDIADGVDSEIVNYNIACMEELYLEARESLNSLLSGEKEPILADLPDMNKVRSEKGDFKIGEKPVLSVGYGHFSKVREDVPVLNNFGATNIQMEIGPTMLTKGIVGWENTSEGEVLWSVYEDETKGKALRIENSLGSMKLYQTVECKPSSGYKFGLNCKYENGTSGLSLILSQTEKNVLSSTEGWRGKSYLYNTSENETELTFCIESTTAHTVCIDGLFLYEVDESGNQKGENLLKNYSFEEGENEYSKSVEYITSTLENAEKNNIAVSLLLSPHYFPKDLSEDIYCDKDILYNFNIDADESRNVIENYLRTLLPLVKGYSSLDNICLSNEPNYSTANFPGFYNTKFQEYLKKIHGTIENLNKAYKSNYSDFTQIVMPSDMTAADELCYDWTQFNDKTVADWHEWMANIVREYLPDVPIHSKILNYFVYGNEPQSRENISRGTDIELFDKFCDYAGNDSCDFKESVKNYYVVMFMYDYQNSVLKKPIYNSEEHVISDGNKEFSKNQLSHSENSVWQGAVHGRDMSTLWVWERDPDETSALHNSILNRPDVVAGIGKTSLDLTRLAKEVTRLQNEKAKTAIFYSKSARVYDESYTYTLFNTYCKLLNLGVKTGVVSDLCIENVYDYDTLIIPDAENCTLKTLLVIKSFLNNGGRVLYMGDALSKDEYNNPIDNSLIKEKGKVYTLNNLSEYFEDKAVSIVDADTGEMPSGLDWQFSADDKGILINVTSLEFDKEKNLFVYYNGTKLDEMTDLITGETIQDSILLKGYEPKLLYFDYDSGGVKNIAFDKENSLLTWNNNNEKYKGVNIYSVGNDGVPEFNKAINEKELSINGQGTFLLKSFSDFSEGKSEIITVTKDKPFLLSLDNVKFGNNVVTCDIGIKNVWTDIAAAALNISVKDSCGKEIGISQYRLILRPGGKDSMRVSVAVGEDADSVVFSAWDSFAGKNDYAQSITVYRNG